MKAKTCKTRTETRTGTTTGKKCQAVAAQEVITVVSENVSKASSKNATKATTAEITAETTLNELINIARNTAVKKPKTTPKSGTLRKNYHCVASYRSEDHRSSLFVYDNGFAAYETDGRTTAIDLDELSSVKYGTIYSDLNMERSDFDSEWLGNLPWAFALTLLGEEQVAQNIFEDDAHELVSEDDESAQNLNKPVFTVHIDGPETAYIRKETNGEIRYALAKARSQMTVKQAEVFALYYDQNMTEKEIGNILGISRQTVSYRLCGAKQQLRECMESFL